MSEIPILGQGKPAETAEEPKPVKLRAAFVVFQDENEQWGASNDPKLLADHIELAKVASPGDISRGAKEVSEDIFVQKVAATVHNFMMQSAQRAQEAAANSALMQKLKV